MTASSGQAPEYNPHHANPNHGLTMIQSHFIVAAKAPGLVEPSEGELNNPAFRKNLKAFDLVSAADDFQAQVSQGRSCLTHWTKAPKSG